MDAAHAEELLRHQDALQAEASRVIAELDLMALLGRAGHPEQVGSSVSGLMVWRDLDFTVATPGLSVRYAWEIMRPLISRSGITKVSYSNLSGHLSVSGRPDDDRYYFVTHYEMAAAVEWKVDITFWLADIAREQRTRALALSRLPREARLQILWLKDIWHRLPTYPYQVGATDIYAAVLEHDVRTPEEFDAYLLRLGLPTRVDFLKGGLANSSTTTDIRGGRKRVRNAATE